MNIVFTDSDEEMEVEVRRQRTFRERSNIYFVTHYEYNERFRMSSLKVEELLQGIGHLLRHPTKRNKALTPKQQLCIALHWLGNGGQFHAVGDMHGVSAASVSRCVHRVVNAVNQIKFVEVVNWPEDVFHTASQFHNAAGMPQVVGAADGTLIEIDAPHENEAAFVDRHGKHSINCMVVCGPDLMFYYVSANWPGSVHDARVMRNSTLCRRMDDGWRPIPNAIILADSGYPLKEWLITPVANVQNDPAVTRFNRAHKSTRRFVECSIGVLKEKFPCLNYLRVSPVFAANIFKCCATLCNLSRDTGEDADVQLQDEGEVEDGDNAEHPPAAVGAQLRLQQLINHFRQM